MTSIEALNANKGADGVISLREAIIAANNTAGTDTIGFNIAGAGPHTIDVLSALPIITGTVILDARTEPDFAGTPIIELNGTSAGVATGLVLSADNSTIRGLVINRFGSAGIVINGDNNTIAGNPLAPTLPVPLTWGTQTRAFRSALRPPGTRSAGPRWPIAT